MVQKYRVSKQVSMKTILSAISIVLFFVLAMSFQSCNTSKNVTAIKEKEKLSDTAWIAMMDNPNTNYNKAVENFETFWKDKRKPIEEGKLFEEAGKNEKDDSEKAHTDTNEPAVKYFFEYKKFKQWQRDVSAFVQADGSILTMDERLKIAREQQQNAEKKN
jgi:hypothetical protein